MSRENVDSIRLSNEAFNRGDVDDALARYHPDVEWHDLNHPPDVPARIRGTHAIRETLEGWKNSFEEFNAHVEEYIDAGDAVVCVTRWHARGTGSGLSVDQTYAEVYKFEDGLIVRVTVGYASRAEALHAIGR
jgi:uncharacterized protein